MGLSDLPAPRSPHSSTRLFVSSIFCVMAQGLLYIQQPHSFPRRRLRSLGIPIVYPGLRRQRELDHTQKLLTRGKHRA